MAEITVATIKALREKTNVGMMDCKAALKEADGDMEEAETILRKKGIADADKKASRTAKEGVIASTIDSSAKKGVLIEVNCETDFVAKNENFTAFVDELLKHVSESEKAADMDALLAQPFINDTDSSVGDYVKAKVGQLGENMTLKRAAHYTLGEEGGEHGVIASYIHLAGKVGVLIEVNCDSDEIAQDENFRGMVKDITLHIAAAQPVCINREEVDSDLVEKEKEIYLDQMKGKPDNIIEKIIGGKLDKFYSNICLLEQAFVKDPDQSINDLIGSKAKELGGEITVRRFTRYALGEQAE